MDWNRRKGEEEGERRAVRFSDSDMTISADIRFITERVAKS